MFNFDGFEILEYHPTGLHVYEPILTVNEKNMIFGSVCFTMLKQPEYVRYLIDPNGKRLAVQGVEKKTKEAVYITPKKSGHQFGIYGSERIAEIRHMMGNWKDNERYKIKGEYFEEENVLVFNFKKAVKFESGVFKTLSTT